MRGVEKFVSHHTTSWSSTSTVEWYAGKITLINTGALVYSTTDTADFTNTYYHPSPEHILRKKTLFLTDVYISTSAPNTHLMKAKRNAERTWTGC